MEVLIKKPYDPSVRQPLLISGVSRTKQSFKDETNINLILERHYKTDVMTHINKDPARYEDLPSGIDFQESLNLAITARDSFDALPGQLRAIFQNDPRAFLEFMDDPQNEKRIVALGLREGPESVSETPAVPLPEKTTPVVEPAPNIEPAPE